MQRQTTHEKEIAGLCKRITAQFRIIFPDGELIKYDHDLETAKELINKIYQAVIKDKSITERNLDCMNEETRTALNALHDYLSPGKFNQCQQGLVFDVRIYIAALACYEKNYASFASWDQKIFWCICVEERIAYCLSTGYLRPHCQGIFKIVEKDQKLSDAGCILADKSSYWAFCRRAGSPGFTFFVDIYGWNRGVSGIVRSRFFRNLMSSKNTNLAELCSRTQHRHGM